LIGQAVGPAESIAIGAGVLLAYSLVLVARPALLRQDDDAPARTHAGA
jgi:hypothetical protein